MLWASWVAGANGVRDQRGISQFEGAVVQFAGNVVCPRARHQVLFGVWDVRVQDYAVFVKATGHAPSKGMWSLRNHVYGQHGDTWQNPGFTRRADASGVRRELE